MTHGDVFTRSGQEIIQWNEKTDTEKVLYQRSVCQWQLDAYYAVQRCLDAATVDGRLDRCNAGMIHVPMSSPTADDDHAYNNKYS